MNISIQPNPAEIVPLNLTKDYFVKQPYYKIIDDETVFRSDLEKEIELIKQLNPAEQVIVVGMGGSSLGAKAMTSIIDLKNLYFLDELNDFKANKLFEKLELEKSIFLVISKSGNTSETLVMLDYVKEKIRASELDIKKHIVAMTIKENDSRLFKVATDNKLHVIDFQKNLSGRFSIYGMAGVLPLVLAGLSFETIVGSLKNALEKLDIVEEIANCLITSIEKKDFAQSFWTYDGRMLHFRAWLRQLVSESLGKTSKAKKSYSLPPFVECRGSVDQHSYLQHILSRPKNSLNIIFRSLNNDHDGPLFEKQVREVEKLEMYFSKYQMRTLKFTLDLRSVTEVCSLFSIWMFAVQVVGEFYSLDVFKQENIDELKKLCL